MYLPPRKSRSFDVYYFVEDVDKYKGVKIVSHEGSWQSGMKGARYGLMMSGSPLLGARYYQELAPGVSMDRSEVVSMDERVHTETGPLEDCLKTEEATPLEPKAKDYKYYARASD